MMIKLVLDMLVNQLSTYIKSVDKDAEDPPVVTGNIGLADGLGGNEKLLQGRIVVSLVNIMEEVTLKNTTPYNKSLNGYELSSPPAFLNLFLLFSAYYKGGINNSVDTLYPTGINRISQLVEFFQSKSIFTVQNSPHKSTLSDSSITSNIQNPELQDLRVSLELYSLTFEQVNHLWGSLGGKQVPFVMYKAGILPLKRDLTAQRGEYIQDIKSTSIHLR